MLSSLPESYDTLVSTLGARNEEEVTFDVAKQHLIAEYERRVNTVVNPSDSILKTVAKVSTYFFCKKPNHLKKNCPKYREWLARKVINQMIEKKNDGKTADKVNTIEESKDFMFSIGNKQKKGFMMDSGVTRHVVNNKEFFKEIDKSYKGSVELANGEMASINGIGTGTLTFLDENGCVRKAKATEVLYAPKLVGNVLSVRQLTKNGFTVEFIDRICQIKHEGHQIGVADIIGELYVLRQPDSVCAVKAHNDNCIHELHRRMGHRDPKKSFSELSGVLDLIHMDVCGPMRTATLSGKRYLVTFIDDYSGFTIVVLLAHKSEVEETMKQFIALCENKFGGTPKVIRPDRGGEYTSKEIAQHSKSKRIQIQLTAADLGAYH